MTASPPIDLRDPSLTQGTQLQALGPLGPLSVAALILAQAAGLVGCSEAIPEEPQPGGAALASTASVPEPSSPVEMSSDKSTLQSEQSNEQREPVADLRLLARREFPVPGRALDLLAADFNSDGLEDVVAAVESPGSLALFRGTPQGLQPAGAPHAVGAWPIGPQVWRTQARPQLWIATRAEPGVEWLALDDRGWVPVGRVELPDRPRALASAQLEVHGPVRGALALSDGSLWWLNAARELERIEGDRQRVTRMAFDPGSRRLWIANQEPPGLSLGTWDEAGAFELQAAVPLEGVPRDLAFADIDRDGDLELVLVGGVEDLLIFGLGANDGQVDPSAGLQVRTPARLPLRVLPTDLDGDGFEELLTLQQEGDGYGVLGAFDPAGRGFARVTSEYAGQKPYALATGDFDGDGTPDLAVSNRDALRISVLPGTGLTGPGQEVFYQAQRLPVGRSPLSVDAGDLDGDGAPDGVVAQAIDGSAGLLANRFGLLNPPASRPLVPSPSRVLVTDLDRDGHADVIGLGRSDRARLCVQLGDGAGGVRMGFEDLDVGQTREITLGSNAVGQASVVLSDPVNGRVGTLVLNGAGEPQVEWTDLEQPVLAATADDGWTWVATGSDRERLVAVDAAGQRLELAELEGHSLRLLLGDNLQGSRELWRLVRRRAGEPESWIELWELPVEGGARRVARSGVGLKAHDLTLGDLDGDGRLDAAVASQNSHQVNLRLRRGESLAVLPDVGAGLGCFGLCLADLDGNGALDLLVANAFSNDVSVIYQRR